MISGDSVYPKDNSIRGLKAAFEKLIDDPQYKEFKNSIQIDGIWDDHDMGVNDGGKYVSFKKDRQDLFMKYITEENKNISNNHQTSSNVSLTQEITEIEINDRNPKKLADKKSEELLDEHLINSDDNPNNKNSVKNENYLYKTIDRIFPNGAIVRFIILDTRSYRDFHYIRSMGEFKYPFTPLLAAFIRGIQCVLGVGREHKGNNNY